MFTFRQITTISVAEFSTTSPAILKLYHIEALLFHSLKNIFSTSHFSAFSAKFQRFCIIIY